jgi:hypothetical protein
MGKKQRNKRRQIKEAQRAENTYSLSLFDKRKEWIAKYNEKDRKTFFVAHKGNEFIYELPIAYFSFERKVTPYMRAEENHIRHFYTNMASCTGRIEWNTIPENIKNKLTKEPFELLLIQNNIVIATAQNTIIRDCNMKIVLFDTNDMKFEPKEKIS